MFVERDRWSASPADWAPNIVQRRTYDTDTREGARVWAQVRLARTPSVPPVEEERAIAEIRSAALSAPRLGQGALRVVVTDAYRRRCAITGERTLPVLDAAHIKPYSESGPTTSTTGCSCGPMSTRCSTRAT